MSSLEKVEVLRHANSNLSGEQVNEAFESLQEDIHKDLYMALHESQHTQRASTMY